MDVESKETIEYSINTAHAAIKDVLADVSGKVETIIRDAVAEVVGAADGWQLSISPITIELRRVVK